jgi:hypothetical protein
MSPEQIGLLVMKIQADDVLASDMRKFISALMTDEEIRRNARLVSSLSGLPEETRRKHALANVLMLLSAQQLAPPQSAKKDRMVSVTPKFVESFHICVSGPWKEHMEFATSLSPMEFQQGVRAALKKTSSPMPGLRISKTLFGHVRVIEEFWGVVGYMAS